MFWGLFLVLLGGLLLLDHWDVYYGGFGSKLIIAALIAWGGSIIINHTRRHISRDNSIGSAEVESTSSETSA